MSQTRGRNAGYRDKANGRQPHHLSKSTFSPPGRTPSQLPSKEPALTASIIKTRSFQFLVDAVGAENIALALDSTLPRVAELMKGERFTPETAFHMETTLGLPHGYFDEPYPALSPELLLRLKSPLEFAERTTTSRHRRHRRRPSLLYNTSRLLRTVRPRMQKCHLRKRRARTAMRRPGELHSPSSQPKGRRKSRF